MPGAASTAEPDRPAAAVLHGAVLAFKRKLVEYLDWRPQIVRVPRSECHWLPLAMEGVPRRLMASSIRLQLIHLTGQSSIGFVWRMVDAVAEVWYWDEQWLQESDLLPVADSLSVGVAPYPENLFRPNLPDGLHLIACSEGVEALAIVTGKTRKTRWFPSQPDAEAWAGFVRDAGCDPSEHALPVQPSVLESAPLQTGWKLQTGLSSRFSHAFFIGMGILVLAGALCSALLAYDFRYQTSISDARREYQRLASENAALLALTRQITANADYFSALASEQPPVSQLALMRSLAEAGLFGEATKISVLEWEYRNGRLRLLFAVPAENFSLSLFLSTLEKQGILQEIRLMPDTPPLTVGIQAVVTRRSAAGPSGSRM